MNLLHKKKKKEEVNEERGRSEIQETEDLGDYRKFPGGSERTFWNDSCAAALDGKPIFEQEDQKPRERILQGLEGEGTD